jgi:hypothetical protein
VKTYALVVCLDGVAVEWREFDAEQETIEAVGEAMRLKEEYPNSVVTLLVVPAQKP